MSRESCQILRLGSVPYLNVRPLLRALERVYASNGPWREAFPGGMEVVEQVPRLLAARARRGEFQGAIVPVFEHFSQPDSALFPGTCIASCGPVESVIVFSQNPLKQIRRIILDPASLTSVNLVRVLADLYELDVEFVEPHDREQRSTPGESENATECSRSTHGILTNSPNDMAVPDRTDDLWPPRSGSARLLIGDEALRRRGTCALEWDLGQAWTDSTGLPFVFAAWYTPHPQLAQPGTPLHALFTAMANYVEEEIENAAVLDGPRFGFSPSAARDYLRRAIHFSFGPREQQGLERFRDECQRLQLLTAEPAIATLP